jgi:hypothetical protein
MGRATFLEPARDLCKNEEMARLAELRGAKPKLENGIF